MRENEISVVGVAGDYVGIEFGCDNGFSAALVVVDAHDLIVGWSLSVHIENRCLKKLAPIAADQEIR